MNIIINCYSYVFVNIHIKNIYINIKIYKYINININIYLINYYQFGYPFIMPKWILIYTHGYNFCENL